MIADNSELYKRLLAAYSIPGEDRDTWLTDMADLFDGEPYAVVEAAVVRYTAQIKPLPREYVRVPSPAAFSDWVLGAQRDAEREQRKALPPPAPPTVVPAGGWARMSGPERVAFFERHVAIGKLRHRHGRGDLNVPFEPDEAEIAGVVGQMRATNFLRGTLERIAAREDVPLAAVGAELTGGRWPAVSPDGGGRG